MRDLVAAPETRGRVAPAIARAIVPAGSRERREPVLDGDPAQTRCAVCAFKNHDRRPFARTVKVQTAGANSNGPSELRELSAVAVFTQLLVNGSATSQQHGH